jgi:hypothetical protein
LTDLGWIGVWLLVAGILAVLVECALAALWSVRLARKARAMSLSLANDQRLIQGDIERLRVRLAETEALWRPYARALRFLRHPLVIALMQSFARRRARA